MLNQAEDKARRLGNFAQKAGKDVEGEFRRAKKEINRFIDENKRTLSDSAVEHLKDKSPTVNVITKVDDFIKQHPIFTCSATMIAIAGVLRVSAENFSDLFQFLNKFTQKIFD